MPSDPSKRTVLLTGAAGEIGHGLVHGLRSHDDIRIIATDLKEIPEQTRSLCDEVHVGDVCDEGLMQQLIAMHEVTDIYHLAALLSTRAEHVPEVAHEVNVGGTWNLLKLAAAHSASHGERVRFILPSTIAIYGLDGQEHKAKVGEVEEGSYNLPKTMYGANKLYCEHLGRYYSRHYRRLAEDRGTALVDFRSLRLPGVIAAETRPTGGTSDFVPEMIHAAATGQSCTCFVRPSARIPWMTMPECVQSLLDIGRVESGRLTQSVYNVASFSASAQEVADVLLRHFPDARIDFEPDVNRQGIVDSWPEGVCTARAAADWGYAPRWNLDEAFEQYIVPAIQSHYAHTSG
ncbi:MAG: epimerase [Phycisphaerae bacterium]|nr:epimerase [Phycisphaerae bacterium]MDG1898493.1 NAD-dependent epimerase/dehydratase family protein [Phycisphaerales bacterium]|tara:strand:- start:10824 stop:11864 length:1041 start_codon:yes stop_codon:yes gene_type:complete